MINQYNRLEIMLQDKLVNLQDKTIAVVGLGGVGGSAVESLARCGFKKLIIVDKDKVDITNLNRQIIALQSTIDQDKVKVMKQRILDINPHCEVVALKVFLNEDNLDLVFDHRPDFVIDACDTISAKFCIINACLKHSIPFVSSMGAANRYDATKINVADLKKTYNDPIAKALRLKFKKARINAKIPVVFSNEVIVKPKVEYTPKEVVSRKELPFLGSNSFVPNSFGLICANYCFNQLLLGLNKQ